MEQFRFIKTILDSLAEAIYVKDLADKIVFVNQAVEQITGWSACDAVGKRCYELFGDPSGNCRDTCPARQITTGKQQELQQFEKVIRAKNGEIRYLQVYASPFVEKGSLTGSVLVMQDITRLRQFENLSIVAAQQLREELNRYKKLEESLRRSEAIYRAMFEYTGTAMLVIDADRTIVMANREIEKMTGCRLEDIVGKRKWDEFVHPEDKERMLQYHLSRRHNAGSAPTHYEFKMFDTRGNIKDIYFTIGMIPGTGQSVGSMIDITERKQMERALQESEEKYRHVLDNIEDVFYEVDLKGNFTFFNNAVERVFGEPKKELLGRNYREIVDKKNAQAVFAAYNKVYTTGVPVRGFAWTVTRPDGERRELEVSISPIRDRDGKIIGFRGIARDITERKRVEERLRYLSLHDTLTGLYNRFYFEEELQRLENGRQFPVSLICGDVDNLKLVNDTMGHKKGDELLQAAAATIKSSIRASDVAARVGGDEFVVLLPETDSRAAGNVCCRIRDAIEQHNRQNPQLPLSISLGRATAAGKEEMADLFKRADDAMYLEKMFKNKHNCKNIKMLPENKDLI